MRDNPFTIKHPTPTFPSSFLRREKIVGSNNRFVFGDRGGFVIPDRKIWHQIDNKYTECEGMWVSNQYAWNSYSYGRPKEPYKNPHTTYTKVVDTTATSCSVGERNAEAANNKPKEIHIRSTRGGEDGHGDVEVDPETGYYMWQIIGIIWQDAYHHRYYRTDTGKFKRAAPLDDFTIITPYGEYPAKKPVPAAVVAPPIKVEQQPLPFMIDPNLVRKEFPGAYLSVMARRLRGASIEEVKALAKAEPEELALILKYSLGVQANV